MKTYILSSLEETRAVARDIATSLHKGMIIALIGNLGAGKTTFAKELIHTLTGVDQEEITSPTFQYLHIYDAPTVIYHFDTWRLESSQEFVAMGLQEYFFLDGICIIEWADKIFDILPRNYLLIAIEQTEQHIRTLSVYPYEKN